MSPKGKIQLAVQTQVVYIWKQLDASSFKPDT